MNKISLFLLLALFFINSNQADCNFTHYEFFSKYSLGKQDEANRTFEDIKTYVKVPNVNYTTNESIRYQINNIKHEFKYIDSRQEAEVIGKDTVLIHGGRLQVVLQFEWVSNGTLNGSGTASIISDSINFQKTLQLVQGYLDYKLEFVYNVTFNINDFEIQRIDPQKATQADKNALLKALNQENGQFVPVKQKLSLSISQFFPEFLSKNLKNEHYPLDDHFTYSYENAQSKKNISLDFNLIPVGHRLEKEGLSLTFVSFLKNDEHWKCGKSIPSQELSPDVYGGIQEFISFSIFQNSVRYAFQKGFLNTDLNKANWQSRFFQFFVGDLYEVIPALATKFAANLKIEGNCTYVQGQAIEVIKNTNASINTTTLHNCELYVSTTKIVSFDLQLYLTTQVTAQLDHLRFQIKDTSSVPNFKHVQGYEIQNKVLAYHMITHSLNRLKFGSTFGTGWKIFPRDYPHILIEDGYIVIYDSSHVGSLEQQLI